MNITDEKREQSINSILDKGLAAPVSTPGFLRNMLRELGPNVIFRGALSGVLLSVLVAAVYVLMIILYADGLSDQFNYHSLLFLFSPLLFLGLTLSTEVVERMEGNGLYELKMTFRYTARQIAGFRLLVFSLAGVFFAIVGGYSHYAVTEMGYLLQLIALSLSSLFLCTLLIIYAMRRFRAGWWTGATVWAVLSILPMAVNRQAWEELLSHLPPALTLGVAAVSFILFLREIKIITKEVRYADC
ncbi:MAG: hypothetical protein FWB75_09085 [Oscillospiraceae bacterium]|nr:hypothetical protein [Oscillospiraceae bacterium]